MAIKKRNKVVVPVVLLLGIIIGGAVVLRTQGVGAALLEAGRKITYDCLSDQNADCDNDGLANWQENLYHTEPSNADTDGDGYVDGEEIASGYDPAVMSPNDALEGTNTSQPRALPKNLTTHLAQILSQKISSGEITPSQSKAVDATNDPSIPFNQDAINDALAQVGMRAKTYFALPEVKDADITISPSPATKESVSLYVQKLLGALQYENAQKLNTNETVIIQETVNNKTTEKIGVLIGDYQSSIGALKEVAVPREFAELHKKQIALFELLLKIFEAVRDFQQDPATAAAAIETYPGTIDQLQSWNSDFATVLSHY